MTNKVSKSKSAVRAAREAVKASQREVLERAARNADDLAVFFSSQERLDGVDDWLQAKIAALREQAEGKRAEHRLTAGRALVALRDRGETMRDISRLTGVGEKALRELIRHAEAGTQAAGGEPTVNESQVNPTDAFPGGLDARDGAAGVSGASGGDHGASLGAPVGSLSAAG
jgi:hypothetical protein